jgi:anti-sigma regulatory factor (Ser/Thr protein kinase)
MDNGFFTSYKIADRSFIAFVKREIHHKVAQTSFGASRAGKIDIIVSELTSNLIKHGGGGELLYRLGEDGGIPTFELYCLDNGAGMANLPQMMRDGVSTTKTLGLGLGAIQRLSDDFQVYSLPNWGTIVYVRIAGAARKKPVIENGSLPFSVLNVPKPGETVSGDSYWVKQTNDEVQILLGDGLGHGPHAREAVQLAVSAFVECEECDPVEIIRHMHESVRKSRGLVATVVVLNFKEKTCRLCGVGNIATRLYDGLLVKRFMPHNGIIGLNIPGTMIQHEVKLERQGMLVMCSDGINTRWELSKFPRILKCDLPIIAALLYKDFSRRNDDASVLVGKIKF